MDPATINATTFTLATGATSITSSPPVSYNSATNVATFIPASALAPSTPYTITVTTGAKDLADLPMASNFTCNFTTGLVPDLTPPTLLSTNPVNALLPCATPGQVTATFSKDMDPTTINGNFTVTGPGLTPVPGAVAYDVPSKTATFIPTSSFAVATTFTATITSGATDLEGNSLVPAAGPAADPWQFSTCTTPIPPAACNLGSAANFVVLAGTTVTNTGPSAVGGNLGLSPGSAVNGFPPGTVNNGTIQIGGSVTAAAQGDLTTAYNDLAGRTLPAPATVSGNQGGLTLYPGIYKSTSSLSIDAGTLTLDGQGDPNAVFVFQIASTLTTISGTKVVLIGSAKANNVCWQVGSSATLGTGSTFMGNIVALDSITLTTNAAMTGRALARNGAVTLDSNIITEPAP
jgi:hypothetical protein